MTILTSVTEFEDKVVETLRDLQRPVLNVVRKGVERADGRVPKLSYPANLPKPAELLDSQVTFAKALIDVQRDFARGFVDVVSPLVTDEDEDAGVTEAAAAKTPEATEAPAGSEPQPAPKAAARKPAVKKTTKK
jgi:hypothetical protein